MRHLYYLRTRLVLSHLLAALTGILILGGLSARFFYQDAYYQLERDLERAVRLGSNMLEREMDLMETIQLEHLRTRLAELYNTYPNIDYALYQTDGSLLLSRSDRQSAFDVENATEIQEAWQSEPGSATIQRLNQEGETMLYLAVRIQHGYQSFGVLQVGAPVSLAAAHAREDLLKLILACALTTLLVGALSWILAERISKHMRALTTTAAALAQGDLGHRVVPDGPYEMRQMAAALNSMADQTQTTMHELRAFVANASHELRTPLTVMKLRVEALRAGAVKEPQLANQFVSEIEIEIDRLTAMINDLLDLSQMETNAGKQVKCPVNALEIVQDVHGAFQIRANKGGLRLDFEQQGEHFGVSGNEDHLRRMLSNLVDNAIKFNYEGGWVSLIAISDPICGKVILQVKDNGPGIPLEHLPHIFERFYRIEKTQPRSSPRRGSGLGLAIAKAIVDNHDGQIHVESGLGAGTTFSVELPLAEVDLIATSLYSELPRGSLRTASQRSQ